MRFAICARREIRCDILATIRRVCVERSLSFSCRQYAAARELLYDIEDGEHPSLVFLEVEQDLSPLCALREAGYSGDVVLISDTAALAVEGYAFSVLDYWLLPMDAHRAYTRLQALIAFARPACLTIKRRSTVVCVPYTDIVFIESRNAQCVIHRADGTELVVYRKLNDIQRQLADERFLRCHQSYLINMDRVVSADHHFRLDDGNTVAIRQRDCHHIREQYLAYVKRRQSLFNEIPVILCGRT